MLITEDVTKHKECSFFSCQCGVKIPSGISQGGWDSRRKLHQTAPVWLVCDPFWTVASGAYNLESVLIFLEA